MDKLGCKLILVEGLEKPFYIASTSVTFNQYDEFCEVTKQKKPSPVIGRGECPVINVNVAEALAYCAWLSKETQSSVRLPKEDEWEFAAKGGNKSKEYEYSGSNNLDEVGWYCDNSGKRTHPVGQKKANELGIFDMSGNVWEWCNTSGVIRGGAWNYAAVHSRIMVRLVIGPDERNSNVGFRVVREV